MRKAKVANDPCVPIELLETLRGPQPPAHVWQEPFDYVRGHCERIATPSEPTDLFDFCDYFLDYQYMDVQRDLLVYALPKALEAWARKELGIPDKDKFKGDWHFEGMWGALAYRPVSPDFLDAQQYRAMTDFLVRILIRLMQKEQRLFFEGSGATPYAWVQLHASMIWLFPVAKKIWEEWWAFSSPQLAICGVQWLSTFLYEEKENPYFAPWSRSDGGGPPLVFETLHMPQKPADLENVEYLRSTLKKGWALGALQNAATVLSEHDQAGKIQETLKEFSWRSILFEERVDKFVAVLEHKDASMIISWDAV